MSRSRGENLEAAFLMPALQLLSSMTLGRAKKISTHSPFVEFLFIKFRHSWSDIQRPRGPVKEILHGEPRPHVWYTIATL